MELRFGDRLERTEFIDAGIIHKDVEAPVFGDSRLDDGLGVGRFLHIASNGDGLTACRCDRLNHLIGAGLAGHVIDDHGSAVGSQGFRDGGADAF